MIEMLGCDTLACIGDTKAMSIERDRYGPMSRSVGVGIVEEILDEYLKRWTMDGDHY